MDPRPPDSVDSPAERLFLEHLERRGAEQDANIDELCRAHPDLAHELRAVAARWKLLAELRGAVLATPDGDATTARAALVAFERSRRVFERYTVGDELARGAQGTIRRAVDLDLDRELAMKVSNGAADDANDARRIGRFIEEARVTARLDHPGIVPIHDVGLDAAGRLFFTMKLVRGSSLQDALEQRDARASPWTLARLIEVLTRVADAMSFAHARGVIHRDLKPSNVMLGGYGEVYVMDWGLARAARDHAPRDAPDSPHARGPVASSDGSRDGADAGTRTRFATRAAPASASSRASGSASRSGSALTLAGDVVGTPHYMPPEQALGELDAVGPPADVYALGALLYHVLAARAPYARTGEREPAHVVLERVRAGPPEPLSRVAPRAPAELVAICEKAMARDVEARYADMQALASDLRAWLEGRVVRAYESGAWPELRKWFGRNRALGIASAIAVLAIIGGLAWSAHVETQGRIAAQAAQGRADATLVDLKRLSELRRLAELEDDERKLWPPHPAQVAPLRAWLGSARELVAHLGDHERVLGELRSGSAPATGLEREWWEATLAELVQRLRAFAAERIPDVERRLAFAETIEQRSLVEPRAAWDEARAIAASSARYGGLALRPQLGLVPLGADPESGWLEFWHVQTGERPARGADGRIAASDEMGVVLVLLPGGAYRLGAQAADATAPNYDAAAVNDERPVIDVVLDPFLISKYELTQRQWQRLMHTNPTNFAAGTEIAGVTATWRNPVTNVSWDATVEALARAALEPPSEPQWEYAARAGTTTPWWSGADREQLRGAENLADGSAARAGARWPGLLEWPEFEDGFPLDAPVGTFRANPFGLHDMLGNVQEWSRDGYGTYPRERDGSGSPLVRVIDENGQFGPVIRGGSFGYGPSEARATKRETGTLQSATNFIGVRAVMRLAR